MPRNVNEWIGKTDNTSPPPRVKQRVAERQNGACARCTRGLSEKLPVRIDHATALILGGANREKNLQALCPECHAEKTALDVKLKKQIARVRQSKLGIARKEHGAKRPFPGGRMSKWKRKVDGTVVRRERVAEDSAADKTENETL